MLIEFGSTYGQEQRVTKEHCIRSSQLKRHCFRNGLHPKVSQGVTEATEAMEIDQAP